MADNSPDLGNRHYANFCFVENGAAVRLAPEVLAWRTDSGERPTDEWLASNGFYGLVETPSPNVDERTEATSLEPVEAWMVSDQEKTVTQKWRVVQLSAAEREELQVKQAEKVRTRRMQLLFLSDYTQLPDFAGNSEVWAVYRQQLRDIPSQAGFPWDVQWPAEPTN